MCLNGKGGAGRIDAESEVLITNALRADGFDASEDGTGRGTPLVAETLRSHPRPGSNTVGAVIAFRASGQEGFTPAEITPLLCNTDGGGTVPTIGFYANDSGNDAGIEISPTLRSMETGGQNSPAIAFSAKDHGMDATEDLAPTLRSMGHDASHANGGGQVAVALGIRKQDAVNTALLARSKATAPVTIRSTRVRSSMDVRRLTQKIRRAAQGFADGWTDIKYRGKAAADGPRYKALGNDVAVPVMRWILTRIVQVHEVTK